MTSLLIRKSEWESLDDSGKDRMARDVAAHYRQTGYPHQSIEPDDRDRQLRLVSRASHNGFDGDDLRFIMTGLGLCWAYMPHAIDVRCNGCKTVGEAFADDELLVRAVRKCMQRVETISDNHLRESLRQLGGVQKPSNFRPVAAASIYRRAASMLGRDRIDVWDMCSGFGGRVVGAHCSGVVESYLGTDASRPTVIALRKLISDIGATYSITLGAAEDQSISGVDLAFTSPPYFNTEWYSSDEFQSCERYSWYGAWQLRFLIPMVERAAAATRDRRGLVIINVANTKSAPYLVADTRDAMKQAGLNLDPEWRYLLGAVTAGGMKSEPVLVGRHK